MSAHAMLGFSLPSPSSRLSSTVPSKPSSSTLSLQKSISATTKMSRQGSYQPTSPSTFSHCTSLIVVIKLTISLFQVVFTYMAIRQRNTIQIIGLVIFNACFVAYSAVQVSPFPPIHSNPRSLKSQVQSHR
jgi:hypothetical protein